MRLRRLTPRLGLEAWPDSLASIDASEAWALLAEHGVLVLRGLPVSDPLDLVRFASGLGDLEPSAQPVAGHPMLTRFTHDADRPPTENVWHSDMSFRTEPPLGAVLHARCVPEVGGDTLFADMRSVLRAVPVAVRDAVEDLEAEHDIAKNAPPERHDDLHAIFPPVHHRLVMVHPVTGDPYLFANTAYTTRVLDVPATQSAALLRLVASTVQVPEMQCRVRWEAGTVVVWDNRHLQHYAVGDYLPAVRTMERATIGPSAAALPTAPGRPG